MEGELSIIAHLNSLNDAQLATSVIVRGELMYMVAKSQRQASNLDRVENFLSSIHVYDANEATADVYGELKARVIRHFGPRDKSKRAKVTVAQLGISDNDLWIAATASQHNLIVVSSDSDFQRMREAYSFQLESW